MPAEPAKFVSPYYPRDANYEVPYSVLKLGWTDKNGDADKAFNDVFVSLDVTNYTKIREEHKVCMTIKVSSNKSLKGDQAVAFGFDTFDKDDDDVHIGVEAVTMFRYKGKKAGKVGVAGAFYPDVTLDEFQAPGFSPENTPFVNENIWKLQDASFMKKQKKQVYYSGTICRKYTAGRSPWKYRIARKAALSVKSGDRTGVAAKQFDLNLLSGASSGIALASSALLTYCLF